MYNENEEEEETNKRTVKQFQFMHSHDIIHLCVVLNYEKKGKMWLILKFEKKKTIL